MSGGHNSALSVCEAFLAQFTYGQIVPKVWFYDQFSYDPATDSNVETQRYARAMERVHDALRSDHHMVLMNVEDGYRITEPHEHAALAQRRVKRGITAAFAEGDSIISATDLSRLTSEQRRELTDAGVRLNGLKLLLGKPKNDFLVNAPKEGGNDET
jgi:hypothetical protein